MGFCWGYYVEKGSCGSKSLGRHYPRSHLWNFRVGGKKWHQYLCMVPSLDASNRWAGGGESRRTKHWYKWRIPRVNNKGGRRNKVRAVIRRYGLFRECFLACFFYLGPGLPGVWRLPLRGSQAWPSVYEAVKNTDSPELGSIDWKRSWKYPQ